MDFKVIAGLLSAHSANSPITTIAGKPLTNKQQQNYEKQKEHVQQHQHKQQQEWGHRKTDYPNLTPGA